MVWQESFSPTGGPSFDSERERERRLAAQARAGADWALTALVARYQPTVVRYLTRLCGNQDHASSMAEHIFQRMERRLHGPHGADNLRLWLLRASTESGLDALRRPNHAPVPQLTGSGVAGLLNPESRAAASGLLSAAKARLRRPSQSTDKQARPLIWNQAEVKRATQPPEQEKAETFVDEELDRIDPREALRHRLVRVTLAELPYGDAQCLALHLVAGLNQAEVARALGITNSAARKRIVHGLALFSDRYTQAVQSLGLPQDLGFGDAAVRTPVSEADLDAPVTPEPIVVPSQASDLDTQPESAEEILMQAADVGHLHGLDALVGVAYINDDSMEMPAISPDEVEEEGIFSGSYTDADPIDEAPEALDDEADTVEMESGVGQVTRLASDAIIGPVVDALPIASGSSASWPMPPDIFRITGIPGISEASPGSVPLAYELNSNEDAPAPPPSSNAMVAGDEGDTLLAFETLVASSRLTMPPDFSEVSPVALETLNLTATRATPRIDEDAVTWEYERPAFAKPEAHEPQEAPARVPVLSTPITDRRVDDAPAASPDEATLAEPAHSRVNSRSLEDIWDEASEENLF